MAETHNKAKRKLPARYPRNQEITIFGDMAELDHVLEGLDDLEAALLNLPNNTSEETWTDYIKHSILYGIAGFLRKAYIEFERFYEREGWSYETDTNLQNDFKYASDFRWRLNELEQGRLVDMPERAFNTANGTYIWPAYKARRYEPAQHACAYALFLAMLMMEGGCSDDYLKSFMADLRYYLTRYHAASLEIVAGRNSVFLPGRKNGAKSSIHKYLKALYEAQSDGVNRKAFERIIEDECRNKTVNGFRMVVLVSTQDNTLFYTDAGQQKTIKYSTILNRHTFPKGKAPTQKN